MEKHPETGTQGMAGWQSAFDASVRIRSKFDIKRKRGEFIGAFAPYGYDKAPGNSDALIVDVEAAAVVRDIFAWYTDGHMSLGAVVRKLNALGVPNPTKYKNQKGLNLRNPHGNDGLWSASSVRRVLSNEVYLGHMVQGREKTVSYKAHKAMRVPRDDWFVVEGTHKAIVSGDTFEKARQILSRNVKTGASGGVYPLAGILKCGECGKAMSRKSSKGYTCYCCRTYREKGAQFCGPHTIREDVLFRAVLEAINLQTCRMEDARSLLRRVQSASEKPQVAPGFADKQALLEKELEGEAAVFDKAYYDFARGLISEAQFIRIREICEKRQSELSASKEMLSQEVKNTSKNTGVQYAGLMMFLKNKRFPVLTRKLALDFLGLVCVYADKSLEIRFRFAAPSAPPCSKHGECANQDNPRLSESRDGVKMKIVYAGEMSIDEALYRYFLKV
ncbi:MAG: recombinase family protein [Oscillospiraceae bacterium]|jgi:hypothetical protein|nr:recombinase family protein [Oscillospiraceae bacterium]